MFLGECSFSVWIQCIWSFRVLSEHLSFVLPKKLFHNLFAASDISTSQLFMLQPNFSLLQLNCYPHPPPARPKTSLEFKIILYTCCGFRSMQKVSQSKSFGFKWWKKASLYRFHPQQLVNRGYRAQVMQFAKVLSVPLLHKFSFKWTREKFIVSRVTEQGPKQRDMPPRSLLFRTQLTPTVRCLPVSGKARLWNLMPDH